MMSENGQSLVVTEVSEEHNHIVDKVRIMIVCFNSTL